MLQKLKALFHKYYDLITYLIFGVLTTVVNYVVYLPCYNLLSMSSAVSNMIAWVAAVAFAFLTNKPFVFRSYDWSPKTVARELSAFLATRIGSGVLETLILFLAVDLLSWNGNLWKLLTSVIVVVVNYLGSKLLVFRK
jgi:putative flippase GtrA